MKSILSILRGDIPEQLAPKDWTDIVHTAREQSVLGVTFEQIKKLPAEQRPPKPLLLNLIACSEKIRERNIIVDETLCRFTDEMESFGCKPIVVKGQVVALEYDNPLARQSGDIDVFFCNDDWTKVNQWLHDRNIAFSSSASEKHIEISFQGVTVELHHHLNAFSSNAVMRYWQTQYEDKALERVRFVDINGKRIRTTGITDTLVHLIIHVHHHLLTEGVGLRQLMDTALFITNHFDALDLNLLHGHLKGTDHEKAFNAYMALMNKYLGLDVKKIPFALDLTDYVYADKIMQEVWKGGNFGHKNNLKGVKPGLLHSLNTARLVIAHSIRFYRLAPQEARAYWLHKIFWRMKRKTVNR